MFILCVDIMNVNMMSASLSTNLVSCTLSIDTPLKVLWQKVIDMGKN